MATIVDERLKKGNEAIPAGRALVEGKAHDSLLGDGPDH